jgi:ABC-type glutathione transport system ATPase component
MEPLLHVENLEKRYETGGLFGATRKVTAFADVSFALRPQTTPALVGASGAGKSTLASCIACLETPTSGRIRFEHREITGLNEKQLRAVRPRIQLVFQDPVSSLNPRLNILDIVTEPLNIHRRLSEDENREHASELLDRVEISWEKVLRNPEELSGGQKQRVAIARALALKPKLLILDEALSALDASVQAQIANLLLHLQCSLGLTYLFITHDLKMAAHLADEIAVMQNGRIVELGATEGVFRNPAHEMTRQLVKAHSGKDLTPGHVKCCS